ncbi:AmmeMemoRadiSam system radical SAM enzyme [Streptomyces spiramyceticus]|uniref:AmmeMemoRadiSam system radical SAM enzyme n=1 Tax=Streptomyces spiramyceticus TaxID=299717 RepID=UPI00237B2DCC|nr:AmmeMemoRadiSam system radical SAM enzyme [Streptomyces spiramyceticus]
MTTVRAARPHWRPALLGEPAAGTDVRCELCPYRCRIRDGQRGYCQVRRNNGGRLETATFTASVAHLDAIERKPFYHFGPGSKVLTVAGPGCSFRCDYCVNHRLSQYGREEDAPWTGEPARPDELAALAHAQGAGLALSYAEPSLAPELTLALAEYARPLGVPVMWKSNGFLTPRAVDLVAPAIDAVNIDVKAAEEAPHQRLTGAPLAPVLAAVERFRAAGVWVEVSTPLIPGTSADPGQLRAIAGLLAAIDPDLPWHLLRFTPDFRMSAEDPTAPSALEDARRAGAEEGLRFVYVERALGAEGRNTRCPHCAFTVVERGIWETLDNKLADGGCPSCRAAVPGRWETQQ